MPLGHEQGSDALQYVGERVYGRTTELVSARATTRAAKAVLICNAEQQSVSIHVGWTVVVL